MSVPGTVGPDAVLSIPLEKSSPVPIYVQIAEGLRTVLAKGRMEPGAALPPERVLCSAYGVSRMTLRQALDIVEREGLIECQRGRGTFVAQPRLEKQQQQLRSFTEEILARGSVPSSRMLSFRLAEPDLAAREFFGLEERDLLFEICRLRLSDGKPVALETVRIPEKLCPGLDRFDLISNSLYHILEGTYGLMLDHCVEEISAGNPDKRVRQALQLSGSAPVLHVHRKTYSRDNAPMELTIADYRGDAYTAVVHSVRR